jgi:hypothetical protein
MVPPKSIKPVFSEKAIKELQIDIAGSFFMDLIGQHMKEFAIILKNTIHPPTERLENGLKELHVEGVSKETTYDNALVPRGRDITGEDIAEVHWLFIVKKDNLNIKKKLTASDYDVYNAYEKNMQIRGSQQFCQSHALNMAYKYYMGQPIPKTNPRDAFVDLLHLWDLLITHIPSNMKTGKNVSAILKPIFQMNKDVEKNTDLVDYVIKTFPKDIQGIYNILNSDEAKEYCPTWY